MTAQAHTTKSVIRELVPAVQAYLMTGDALAQAGKRRVWEPVLKRAALVSDAPAYDGLVEALTELRDAAQHDEPDRFLAALAKADAAIAKAAGEGEWTAELSDNFDRAFLNGPADDEKIVRDWIRAKRISHMTHGAAEAMERILDRTAPPNSPALLEALGLAANRIARLALEVSFGSLLRIEAFEWEQEARAAAAKATGDAGQ